MVKKTVTVLGATGSIGKSALDVISRSREDFEVVLLTAHSKEEELKRIGSEWPKAAMVLAGEELLRAITAAAADITINGISGAAGLEPSVTAIDTGTTLALANKETIVMAGSLVLQRAAEKKAAIVPVDSEHSAIFQLLNAHGKDNVEEIILTASGGPFRHLKRSEMEKISPKDALAHPTWKMGPKITVDSASMANKGLEVIEAVRLFNMPVDKIKVLIHPQSIVHAMIRLKNGMVFACLSQPDMRLPIQQALYWPLLTNAGFEHLEFESLCLEFYKPDMELFPMLALAYQVLSQNGYYPCVYNGANEEAVKAFLSQRIGFLDIPRIVEYVLNMDWSGEAPDIVSVLEADRKARDAAKIYISEFKE